MNEERTPIIVGVGQVNDRPADALSGLDPVALMTAALRKAESDAGASLLEDADLLAVVKQISFPQIKDAVGPLATDLSAGKAELLQTEGPNGDSPIMLLNLAANRIGAGDAEIALVVGAEALRTAAAKVAAAEGGRRLDPTREASHRRKIGYAQSFGLVAPVDVYPLYENALRSKLRQTLAESQQETGEIWARFSEVAAANENAWIRSPVDGEAIITASERNRPIAFPYTKLQVANSSVNQGAGFIVTSLGEARRRGIPQEKWIYVGNGAAAHERESILQRDRYDQSTSMEVSIRRTLEINGLCTEDLSTVELYSCFPCIPKMARRILDWPVHKPATVFGGLTFGGGPIGNYMSHAVASMVDKLRAEGGIGLLFANGGFATHNHTIVASSSPIAEACFPRDFDFQEEADAARADVPDLDKEYVGPATIESFTVHFNREGSPRGGVIVARTEAGSRTLASVPKEDIATLERLTSSTSQPVGLKGIICPGEPLRSWYFV